MPAVNLRVKVLEAQNRKDEMAAFLDSIANATTSIEQAEDIENAGAAENRSKRSASTRSKSKPR